MLRIFVSYAPTDATFATQLITDLRHTGAEVLTDRIGAVGIGPRIDRLLTSPDDITFGTNLPAEELSSNGEGREAASDADTTKTTSLNASWYKQFLSKKLSQCQHLIVIQTPTALQSPRVRAVFDAALKQTQAGQMGGVLRVIAPTPKAVQSQEVPLTWANTPEFDASKDYPRALARLCLHLGIGSNDIDNVPPPPAPATPFLGLSNPSSAQSLNRMDHPSGPHKYPPDPKENKSLAALVHDQRSAAEDRPRRPLRYPRIQLRRRLFFLSLAMLLVLSVASAAVLINRSSTHDKLTLGTPTPRVVIHTSTPTPKPTPTPTVSSCHILPNDTDCTNRDPTRQGCTNGAETLSRAIVKGKDGNNIGYVELLSSNACHSKWAQTTVYNSCRSVNISTNIQRPGQTYQGKEYADQDPGTSNNNPPCEPNFSVFSPMVFAPGTVKAKACGNIQGSSLVCTTLI